MAKQTVKLSKRLAELLVAAECNTVDFLAPENVPEGLANLREEWREYGEGQTLAQYMRANGYMNKPKPGWQWFVELNSEEGASGYGYASYEDAALAAHMKYSASEGTPAQVVTHELLCDWHFGAAHVGEPVLAGENQRYDTAYYLRRLREWWRLYQRGEYAQLAELWGFEPQPPKVSASELVFTYRAHVLEAQLKLAEEQVEQLLPIEDLRAAAARIGVRVKQTATGNWGWYYAPFQQRRDRYVSERAALCDVCRMNGGLCGLRAVGEWYY